MKTPNITQEQAKEMYQILVEIRSALEDKKNNKGGLNKINLMEIGWLMGIEEYIKSCAGASTGFLPSKMKVVAILNQIDGLVATGVVHPLDQTKKIAKLLGLAHLKNFNDNEPYH